MEGFTITIKDSVIEYMSKLLDFETDLSDLYSLGFNPNSLRSAISRMVRNDLLERVDRGVYKLILLFRKFRHTKRIKETRSTSPQRAYNIDIEATSEGYVPVTNIENNLIDLFHSGKASVKDKKLVKSLITKFEAVINPKLVDETLSILAQEGLFVNFRTDLIVWKVTGSEFRDDLTGQYDETHEVEVILVNDVARHYTFYGSFEVDIDEYN